MRKELICIGCPIGCTLQVQLDENGTFVSVTGNGCKKGAQYGKTECTDPRRTLTTTVLCEDGVPVAVKTAQEIPKSKLMEAMELVSRLTAKLPVHIGDVIAPDICGSPLIATQSHPRV